MVRLELGPPQEGIRYSTAAGMYVRSRSALPWSRVMPISALDDAFHLFCSEIGWYWWDVEVP